MSMSFVKTSMNVFNIENAFKQKAERNWHTLYVLVDAHGTIIKPGHDKIIFYDGVLEVMKWFSDRNDFKIILWTSSHPKEVDAIVNACKENGIKIDFVNENPLEKNSERANFDKKLYFNILLDDKAGMVPETDWKLIKNELQKLGEWNKTNMTETKSIMKQKRAIFIQKLPLDAPNFLGYGATGSVINEPTQEFEFVSFKADGGQAYSVNIKDLYFAEDV